MGGNLREVELLVDADNDQVGRVVLHVEGERFLGDAHCGLDGCLQLVSAVLVVAETNDAIYLADKESLAFKLLDLTKSHLGGDISADLGLVLADEVLGRARAVGDVEALAIGSVGSRFALVVQRVGEAVDVSSRRNSIRGVS